MITITKLEKTCAACPSQWEGETLEGDYIYIRYRWGYLSVTLDSEEVFGEEIGEDMDGIMDFYELEEATKEKITFEL